jgi:hypothetical protein
MKQYSLPAGVDEVSLYDLDVLFPGKTLHLVCGELSQTVPQNGVEGSSSSTADFHQLRTNVVTY